MTQEEKAKRYDERLEKARKWYDANTNEGYRQIFEDIFPELTESEDEKMKKIISDILLIDSDEIRKILDANNVLMQDVYAWLEKQKESKYLDTSTCEPWSDNQTRRNLINFLKSLGATGISQASYNRYLSYLEKQGEQNLAFIEKGKWYVCIRTSYKPDGKDFIEGKTYYAKEDYKIIGECGKVDIATDNPEEFFRSATEEETNDIIKNFVNEQKPVEWSEEDYTKLKIAITLLEHPAVISNNGEILEKTVDWLNSLKERCLPQPKQEWSEEDKRNLEWLITVCERIHYKSDPQVSPKGALVLKDWLKSLKDRCLPQQKPLFKKGDIVVWQDEEYNILDVTTDSYNVGGYIIPIYRQNEFTIKQKPAWSEEDENLLGFTLCNLAELKDRYDEKYGKVGKCMDWLKSLKERVQSQPQWKPSKEQMDVLLSEVTAWTKGYPKQKVLESLYNDLKKLKG